MSRKRNVVNDHQKANGLTLVPKNRTQASYIASLQRGPQTFVLGPAGTGKTYIAAVMAASLYLRGVIDRIILSRPAVAAGGEEHGFLPGDLTKKLAPWARPVVDELEECLGKEAVIGMIKSGELEVIPFTYMRGLTFRNAFIILDEAQNTTPKQMELFLTRIGEGSRLVVNGDIAQSDLKDDSGLAVALDLIDIKDLDVDVIEFTEDEVVRSEMCKQWAKAFAK